VNCCCCTATYAAAATAVNTVTTTVLTTTPLQDSLPTIEWDAPMTVDDIDPAAVTAIKEQLPLDIASVPPLAPDVYNFGKALARMARLG
jgi:hypothetical protein